MEVHTSNYIQYDMLDEDIQMAIVLLIHSNKWKMNIPTPGIKENIILHVFIFILLIWIFCMHVCLHYKGGCKSLKRMSDPLELGLQTIVSSHWVLHTYTQLKILKIQGLTPSLPSLPLQVW